MRDEEGPTPGGAHVPVLHGSWLGPRPLWPGAVLGLWWQRDVGIAPMNLAELRRIHDDRRLWLARQMRRRCWNQSDLARRTGISKATVSRLTMTDQEPSFETMLLILEAFARETP